MLHEITLLFLQVDEYMNVSVTEQRNIRSYLSPIYTESIWY